MKRRAFLLSMAALAGTARAQTAKSPAGLRRVAVLAPSTRAKEEVTLKPFFDGMRELGWIEDRNIVYDKAYAGDDHRRLPVLMAELVKRKPEVVFAPPAPAALAASRGTRDIPIVFSVAADPVALGLVRDLARPGRNVTGVTYSFDSMAPKQVEVLKQLLPAVASVALLFDPTDSAAVAELRALGEAAPRLGVTLIGAEVRSTRELDSVTNELLARRPGAVLLGGALLHNSRRRVLELAAAKGIPVTSGSILAEEGALFTYGFSLAARIRRASYYVDRILKGAKPRELPVEQISTPELVINVKVARQLGIAVPHSVLLRADRVIE